MRCHRLFVRAGPKRTYSIRAQECTLSPNARRASSRVAGDGLSHHAFSFSRPDCDACSNESNAGRMLLSTADEIIAANWGGTFGFAAALASPAETAHTAIPMSNAPAKARALHDTQTVLVTERLNVIQPRRRTSH